MKMRLLGITDDFKERCDALRRFAEDPANWYRYGQTSEVPGNNPNYVLETAFGYRAVFTITHAPDHQPKPFRHLSISVSGDEYPNPTAVFTIAHYLGFTGAVLQKDVAVEPGYWGIAVDENEHCIVVQQDYEMN